RPTGGDSRHWCSPLQSSTGSCCQISGQEHWKPHGTAQNHPPPHSLKAARSSPQQLQL
ncbi:hypothetical protein BGZ98_001277, partial [Dissophora globulifera]